MTSARRPKRPARARPSSRPKATRRTAGKRKRQQSDSDSESEPDDAEEPGSPSADEDLEADPEPGRRQRRRACDAQQHIRMSLTERYFEKVQPDMQDTFALEPNQTPAQAYDYWPPRASSTPGKTLQIYDDSKRMCAVSLYHDNRSGRQVCPEVSASR